MDSLGASVLVVEDDETLAMGLASALEHERFTVLHCDTGEKAVAAIEDDPPDVMILDVMLPGMDGLSVLRRVKTEHPGIPVLLLTAKSAELDRVLGLELGADDYITKPFSLRELIARVKGQAARPPGASSRTREILLR